MTAKSRNKGAAGERRILPWAPDYDVSDQGEVRRLTPTRARPAVPYTVRGTVPPSAQPTPYRRVKLTLPDGRIVRFAVHRLVCEAFHGAAPTAEHQVAHGDGNSLNNAAWNLRWVTARQNAEDRERHGRTARGERGGLAKLTAEQVRQARRRYTGKRGERIALARELGVSGSLMSQILMGRVWRHV